MTALLTASEVAKRLGVSPRAIYELAASRRIGSYRFGRAVRFSSEEVEAYVQASHLPPVARPQSTLRLTSVSVRSLMESPLEKYFEEHGLKPRRKNPASPAPD